MKNNSWLSPTTLSGQLVTLEPLSQSHCGELKEACQDGELWKLWFTSVPSPDKVNSYVSDALTQQAANNALPFVVIDNKSQKLIGSTRYCNIDNQNKRLEIGYTWYASSFQRTGVNTETKYLLLNHAFENLKVIATELRTSNYNHRSQQAILRLGAKLDGVLRNHQQLPTGGYRDTHVYSITNNDWPAVKQHLRFKMQR